VGELHGQHYFSMKLIEGGSLVGRVKQLRGDTRTVASLMATVARAVHYAHQHAVLHRDLKPGNILLDENGEPHVTDFGLAKLIEHQADLTMTGTVLGTPNYLSPEQGSGSRGQLTTASDVFSLGAILYEMVTGCP